MSVRSVSAVNATAVWTVALRPAANSCIAQNASTGKLPRAVRTIAIINAPTALASRKRAWGITLPLRSVLRHYAAMSTSHLHFPQAASAAAAPPLSPDAFDRNPDSQEAQ